MAMVSCCLAAWDCGRFSWNGPELNSSTSPDWRELSVVRNRLAEDTVGNSWKSQWSSTRSHFHLRTGNTNWGPDKDSWTWSSFSCILLVCAFDSSHLGTCTRTLPRWSRSDLCQAFPIPPLWAPFESTHSNWDYVAPNSSTRHTIPWRSQNWKQQKQTIHCFCKHRYLNKLTGNPSRQQIRMLPRLYCYEFTIIKHQIIVANLTQQNTVDRHTHFCCR